MRTGAIVGDVVGSVYERNNLKRKDFEPLFADKAFFTDDSVHTVAVMSALMRGARTRDFEEAIRGYTRNYPERGYGSMLLQWAGEEDTPAYGSFGNGSAMRASACGWWARSEVEASELAARSAMPTHDDPEGIKGAQAVAIGVWLARTGGNTWYDRNRMRGRLQRDFNYDLDWTVDEIRPGYHFDPTCQGSVPEALVCALEAESFEDAIRNAISIGGDSDTIAAIAGGVAGALWEIPEWIQAEAMQRLDAGLRATVEQFEAACTNRQEQASREERRT